MMARAKIAVYIATTVLVAMVTLVANPGVLVWAAEGSLEVRVRSAGTIRVPVMWPDQTFGEVEEFAVEVTVRDGSDADTVQICKSRTSLVNRAGEIIGKIASVRYVPGGGGPDTPREFTVQLRFTLPPARGEGDRLHLIAQRYRSSQIPFEWSKGDASLQLPLEGEASGLSTLVETMMLGVEDHPKSKNHLIVKLTANAPAEDMDAPVMGFAEMFMTAAGGGTLRPDLIQTNTDRPYSAGLCTDTIEVAYHFFEVTEIPQVSKISFEVQAPVVLATGEAWAAIPAALLALAAGSETVTLEQITAGVVARAELIEDVRGAYDVISYYPPRDEQAMAEVEQEIRTLVAKVREATAIAEDTEAGLLRCLTHLLGTGRTVRTHAEFVYLQPGRYRLEIDSEFTTAEESWNTRIVEVNDRSSVQVTLTTADGTETEIDPVHCPIGWLAELLQGEVAVTSVVSEQLAGRPCHVLSVDMPAYLATGLWIPSCPSVLQMKVWIDAETFVWHRTEEYGKPALLFAVDGGAPERFVLDEAPLRLLQVHEAREWAQYDGGVWLPGQIVASYQRRDESVKMTSLDLTYAAVNEGLADDVLQRPLPSTVR